MEAFSEYMVKNFENEMVDHVKKFAPQQADDLGDERLHEIVNEGIERAKKYKLTNRGPVRFYVELMFLLGNDFDTDPRYPWVSNILNDFKITDQMERANIIHEKYLDYKRKIAGQKID